MQFLSKLQTNLAAHPRWWAVLLGGLAACGFEPLSLWPLTLLAIAGLIELTARAANWKRALLTGWLFGLSHFTVGNAWIATAFTYQANMPVWLGWIAVLALSLYLAVYPALAALGTWVLGRRNYAALILSFAALWIVTEWLRSWVFTGFVWNPLAMAALGPFDRPGLASLAPELGTYGLSGLVALLAGSWLLALKRGRFDLRGGAMILLPAALMLLPSQDGAEQGTIPYTLVQPDVPQEALNEPAEFERNFTKAARLAMQPPPQGPRLVMWPESGVQDYLREGYPPDYYIDTYGADPALARQRLARVAGQGGMLLTGAVDLEMQGEELVGARNVVTAIDGEGTIRGSYAKAHLVPYGEYLPLRWLLEPLGASRLVPGNLDFFAGPGPRTLDLGRFGKAGVQICYEIVFSGQVADRGRRPDYIFNPSNDGWFGSWGPPQHLAQARMRAIEEGLPVLRATTNGISAVIDANGIVRQSIPEDVSGRVDGSIPPAKPPTLFARFGNVLPLGWAVLLFALSLVATRHRRS